MTVPTHIRNAQLPDRCGSYDLVISETGIIEQIIPRIDSASRTSVSQNTTFNEFNVQGDWISQGGIDLQINGALGLAFPDLCDQHTDGLLEICHFLWDQGIDGFFPTLVTTSIENIHRAFSVIATVQKKLLHQKTAATLHGVHLEGPCLHRDKRGAHPQEYLQPLTVDTMKRVLGDYASLVSVITLAPELDQTEEVIPFLRSLGITVSLGHSQATAEQAARAFDQGATMVTHAFNAMPPLHHRKPGLLGAALTNTTVSCGLIADGQHVCPTMLDLLIRTCRGGVPSRQTKPYPPGIFLVSDALSPLGLPDGVYPWDTRQINVQEGTARLEDGTLAGTTNPLLIGAQNLVKWGICEPREAIALATVTPRQAIGLTGLVPGQPAQLLRWSFDQETRSLTWKRL